MVQCDERLECFSEHRASKLRVPKIKFIEDHQQTSQRFAYVSFLTIFRIYKVGNILLELFCLDFVKAPMVRKFKAFPLIASKFSSFNCKIVSFLRQFQIN